MLENILAIFRAVFDAASGWFLTIIGSLEGNWFGFLVTMFTIATFSRFILVPIFRVGWGISPGSDAAKPVTPKPKSNYTFDIERAHFGNYGGYD